MLLDSIKKVFHNKNITKNKKCSMQTSKRTYAQWHFKGKQTFVTIVVQNYIIFESF